MKRQWFFAVALLSFLVTPAIAEEKEQCPPLEVKLAEVAEKHAEEVIYQMPIASSVTLIVTASRAGTWHLLVAEGTAGESLVVEMEMNNTSPTTGAGS